MTENLTKTYNHDEDADNLILIDCNGTLFLPTLNKPLVEMIDAAKESGQYRVVIFSNDVGGNQKTTDLLGEIRHKDKDFYGEVAYKAEYSGRKALMVFDDDHSSHSVNTTHMMSPLNEAAIRKMTFWMKGGVPAVDAAFRLVREGVPPSAKIN